MESCRAAETIPTSTPITTETRIVSSASSSVTGKRRTNSSRIGWRVQYERPKSPRSTMLPIHSAYCTCIGRSRPRSWRRAASVGAYACPSTIRVATSPGMSRSSRNTMMLTRNRVGTASATRRSTYCFTRALLVEPGEDQPHPDPVAVVVLEALDVLGVGDVLRPLRRVDVVRLVGEIALDVVDDLLTLLGIHLASLRDQHAHELGVRHVAEVGRQLGRETSEQKVVDLREWRRRAHGHLFVLADHGGRRVLAVLLRLQLDGDADLPEIVGGELVVGAPRHHVARPVEHR